MEEIKWKKFVIGEVFTLKNSTAYHKSNLIRTEDTDSLPYITRTSLNNGLEMFVEKNDTFKVNEGNQIVFGAENADFFYQEYPFITGNKMYTLSHEKMNKYIGLFLVTALRNSIDGGGLGYSLGMTATRLSNRQILLPSDSNGSPNWEYMESYIRELEVDKFSILIEYFD